MTYIYIGFFSFVALSVLEALARHFFWPPAYRLGLRILRQHAPSMPPAALAGYSAVTQTTNAKFKVVDGAVLIRRRWRFLEYRTSLDLVGRLSGTDSGDWVFEVRVPAMTVAFLAIWLASWSVGAVAQAMGTLEGGSWLLVGVGYAGLALITGFSVTYERQHMRRLLEECLGLIAPGARLTSASS